MDTRIEDRPLPPPAPRHHPGDRRRGNARKHGLYGVHAVAAGEDPAAFREFRGAIVDTYRPRDDGEIWIVAEIAETMWRTRRLRRTETRLWNDAGEVPAFDAPALRSAVRIEAHLDLRFSRMLLNLERHRRLIDRWNRPPTPPTWPIEDDAENDGGAPEPAAEEPDDWEREPAPEPAVDDVAPNGDRGAVTVPVTLSAPPSVEAADPDPDTVPDAAAGPLPANPRTRDDFARLARARLPVVQEAAALLESDTTEAYDRALELIGPDMRRWWEMRVARTPGVRETWRDISRRHPFWEKNRTPRALLDWLSEVEGDDTRLLDEIEREGRKRW